MPAPAWRGPLPRSLLQGRPVAFRAPDSRVAFTSSWKPARCILRDKGRVAFNGSFSPSPSESGCDGLPVMVTYVASVTFPLDHSVIFLFGKVPVRSSFFSASCSQKP